MGNEFPGEFYLDGYHHKILLEAKERNDKNFDTNIVVVGEEGAGKTTFAFLSALALNWKSLNIDNCVFNSEQFMKAVDNADPYTVIIYDEADDMGNHWADKLLIALKKKMKRIRKKNLFIFLVTPDFFELNKYFVIHRAVALINVYTGNNLDRGYWSIWNRHDKRQLYIKGKKFMDISSHPPTKFGRFRNIPSWFPIDMKEYENKKDAATELISDYTNPRDFKAALQKEFAFRVYSFFKDNKDFKVSNEIISEIVGVHKRTFYKYLSDLKQEGKL